MRNTVKELRAWIRGGALEVSRRAAALEEVIKNRRWRFPVAGSFSAPSLPHFFSQPVGLSLRGVPKAPKVMLLGLLILQLLVLAVLRSAPSKSASSQPMPAFVGSSRTLYSVDHGKKRLHEAADQGHVIGERSRLVNRNAASKEPGELVFPSLAAAAAAGLGDESGVLSTALDDAASSVSTSEPQETSHNDPEEVALEDKLPQKMQGGEEAKISLEMHDEDEILREEQHEFPQSDEETVDQQQEEQEQQEQSLVSASEAAFLEEEPVCKGGRIFIYNLPSMFNADLLANCSVLNPWVSLCDALSNGGLGKPMESTPWPSSTPSPWFYTEQFSGEVIFHTRMLQHPCVTNDSSAANIFYVPFYAGLDVSRYLWRPSQAKDRDFLGRKLIKWLSKQPAWARNRGKDHFTMIGRITWDFRRTEDKEWGSGLLNMAEMKNMSRLVIECDPWEGGEFGVPYPTSFHPRNEHQMQEWQEFVRNKDRGLIYSFAGATRKKIPNDFRLELLAQCSEGKAGDCSFMDCSDSKCETPEPVLELFLNSTFCLQPRGDSYTRRSIFDSVLAGCIPVFFWNQSSYWQYKWFFPEEDESYSVFIDKEDVRKGTKIMKVLSRFSAEDVRRMRNNLVDALPKLVYATADHQLSGADAFDTAIDGILRTMLRMNLRTGALQRNSG